MCANLLCAMCPLTCWKPVHKEYLTNRSHDRWWAGGEDSENLPKSERQLVVVCAWETLTAVVGGCFHSPRNRSCRNMVAWLSCYCIFSRTPSYIADDYSTLHKQNEARLEKCNREPLPLHNTKLNMRGCGDRAQPHT